MGQAKDETIIVTTLAHRVQSSYRHFSQTNPQGTKKIDLKQEKQNLSFRCNHYRSRITDIRTRQRTYRYQRDYKYGNLLFRDPGTKLIYSIGAVMGLIGGIKVYGKFSSGDPDTSKTAASWFGACIFLIVSATILRSFFL